jgi:hypothetical protein
MITWLLGTLPVLILAIKLLNYLELVDVLDFLSMPRLMAVLFFGIAAEGRSANRVPGQTPSDSYK